LPHDLSRPVVTMCLGELFSCSYLVLLIIISNLWVWRRPAVFSCIDPLVKLVHGLHFSPRCWKHVRPLFFLSSVFRYRSLSMQSWFEPYPFPPKHCDMLSLFDTYESRQICVN
jgi:hypothetical protein